MVWNENKRSITWFESISGSYRLVLALDIEKNTCLYIMKGMKRIFTLKLEGHKEKEGKKLLEEQLKECTKVKTDFKWQFSK